MTETTETLNFKELEEISIKSLADAVSNELSQQVGGEFKVTLTKLEHTNPGFVHDKLVLQFHVEDKSWSGRLVERMHASRNEE